MKEKTGKSDDIKMVDTMNSNIPLWFTKMDDSLKELLLDGHKVTDENLFCRAFMESGKPSLRRRAVILLKDQEKLFHYALNDPDAGVRSAAAVRLEDNARKRKIIDAEKKPEVQEVVAAAITDEAILYDLAVSHPNRWVRKAAILHLKDNNHLMKIVFSEDEESELRYYACRQISDQNLMVHILMSPELWVSITKSIYTDRNLLAMKTNLVHRIDDHELMRKIASDKNEYEEVRIAAVKKLGPDDQELLRKIAADKPEDSDLYDYCELRAAAVSRLTDEDLLKEYLCSSGWQIRLAAMTALKDQKTLKETVVDEYCNNDMRETALRYINDQDFLYEIALHDEKYIDGPALAAMAAERIEDPERLANIAIGAATFEASRIAAENLHDDGQLLRILQEVTMDENDERKGTRWLDPVGQFNADDLLAQEIKCVAAENLSDRRPLVRFLLDDPGDGIYITAGNFKEYGIELLSDNPELMLEYVREETDSLALDCAWSCVDDRRVYQAIVDNPHSSYRTVPTPGVCKDFILLEEVGLGK